MRPATLARFVTALTVTLLAAAAPRAAEPPPNIAFARSRHL